MNGMNIAGYQGGFSSGNMGGTWGMMNHSSASGFYSEFGGKESAVGGGIFDGMALPDHFLGQYYTQVRNDFEILLVEVWKLLDYKMHRNADVKHSASVQRHGIKSLLPAQNNRIKKYFPILV